MIEYCKGDLLQSDIKYIAHGCNCKLSMGAGIAQQIRHQFPKAHKADLETLWGDPAKMGTFTEAYQHGKVIINAYTQFNYSTDKLDVDYDAVRTVMEKIELLLQKEENMWEEGDEEYKSIQLGMPRIGCGLAGGDWNIVEGILDEVFANRTIYVYDWKNPDWILSGDEWDRVEKNFKNGTWKVSQEG